MVKSRLIFAEKEAWMSKRLLVPTSSHGRGSRGTGLHSVCTADPCLGPLPPTEKHNTDSLLTTLPVEKGAQSCGYEAV